ncbi:MAG: hypothetical protein AB7T59_16980 [Hyphomonadaceae bacterium]
MEREVSAEIVTSIESNIFVACSMLTSPRGAAVRKNAMCNDQDDRDVTAEEMGAASELTCDAGNHLREMNGQPLEWA